MSRYRASLATVAVSTVLVAGGLLVPPAANAAQTAASSVQSEIASADALQQFTPTQISDAIEEARAGGYVVEQTTDGDGSVRTTLDLGEGLTFDLVQPAPTSRLSAGTDSKGADVAFNSTDQNMIISGAAFGLGAGLCAISAGTFCVVAGAILTAAAVAITSNGGVRCSGGEALRVYPFAGGKVKPRCV